MLWFIYYKEISNDVCFYSDLECKEYNFMLLILINT